jgi:hypothetical protein
VEKTGKSADMKSFFSLLCPPFLLFGAPINTHVFFTGEVPLTIRTITQAFTAIGYKLDMDTLEIQNGLGELRATAIGNKAFDFLSLSENLKEQGIQIEKANLQKSDLTMLLNTQQARWNPPFLGKDEGVSLKRVSAPQWFRVEAGERIRIEPPYVGKWYPEVAVLDSSMRPVLSWRSLEAKEELELELPVSASYLKISNVQGMKVLKEGMWIESMSLGR